MDAILNYAQWHAADLVANLALFLGVFLVAHMAKAGQFLALTIATAPLLVLWAMQDPMAHGLIARVL